MTAKRITFADFSGGEFGEVQSFRAPRNSFTGKNVMVTHDGAVLPRNGLKQITLSGTSPAGVVLGMGHNPLAAPGVKTTWFVIGTTVYLLDASTGACVAATGSLAATPTKPVKAVYKNNVAYLFNDSDKAYKLDMGTATLSALADFPTGGAGYCATWYGSYVAASKATENVVYFSDAGDPETWNDLRWVQVGDGSGITGLWSAFDGLVIAKADGSWHILRGTPEDLANPSITVRQVLKGVSPVRPENAAITGNGRMAYTIGSSTSGSVASLGFFNGSDAKLVPHLFFGEGRLTTEPSPSHQVVPMKEDDDFFVLGAASLHTDKATVRRHGIFTQHEFDVATDLEAFVAGAPVNDVWVLTDGGAAATTPKFYLWRVYNHRPGFTSDSNAQPGDASTTPLDAEFTLPEWFAEDGSEVAVQSVVIDYLSYDTGSATPNNITVTPTAVRLFEGDSHDAGPQSVTPATSSTVGTPHRKRFDFGDSAFGNGFRLRLSALRGVAILKVQAHVIIQGSRF